MNKLVCICVWSQLVFSDSMPDDIKPGEKLFVVVDGVTYQVVNDDGSDLGSAGHQQLSVGATNKNLCDHDDSVCVNKLAQSNGHCGPVTDTSGSGSPDKITLASLMSPKHLVQQINEMDRASCHGVGINSDGVTSSDTAGNSSVHVAKTNSQTSWPQVSLKHTVLAENDDEFHHLSAEFADKLESHDLPPTDVGISKPTTFVNSFLGFVRSENAAAGRLPFQQVQLPKVVVQARVRPRLPTQTTANSVSVCHPATVTSVCLSSSPKKHVVTTVIQRASSEKAVDELPSVSPPELPLKKKKKTSVEMNAAAENGVTTTVPKPTRQPRNSKRMSMSCCRCCGFLATV